MRAPACLCAACVHGVVRACTRYRAGVHVKFDDDDVLGDGGGEESGVSGEMSTSKTVGGVTACTTVEGVTALPSMAGTEKRAMGGLDYRKFDRMEEEGTLHEVRRRL